MKKLITLVAAMAMVATFAMTAAAAEWDFYGSARVSTWFTTTETEGSADVDQFAEGIQGNARIGANVKVSDELTGRFEYGSGPNLRLLYATWDFGVGSFVVGQAYTPIQLLQSNQVYGPDNDMVSYGSAYSGRAPQLKLKFGDFQIAAVAPSSDDLGSDDTAENSMPTIEASYSFSLDNFKATVAGGYNTYEIGTYDVDSWVVAGNAAVTFAGASLKGGAFFGQNAGNIIYIDTDGSGAGAAGGFATTADGALLDTDCFGYTLMLGYMFNDMFSVEFGYGHAETEADAAVTNDEVTTYYAQTVITLAPGVYVIPEIGRIDFEENTGDVNNIDYIGAKWQINF